ncbi:MAG: arsenate reductase (glutaredoxin) [Thiopseudomonas sp.]|jgi:arsenate reductase|nr:arsenate reductase (glutaredoxin) [Thiopseudomonas sp.]MBP9615110.1 arsenate reductase (glutaredoxin) [Thiopseudomonas sp.]HAB92192.1 arsenate reductase (glutaredoxin) [Pseudomonas sp.]HHX05879.1 arsenate reductase (glutaredoxin) [Pseudomonas sp.]
MTDITLYHYSRCSKSRAALAMLEERGINATVVHYLDTPLNAQQLSKLLEKLGLSARQMMRQGEAVYSEMNLDNPDLSEAQLIDAMVQAPILIERPILAVGSRAAIGRPIDNLIELLP